MIRILLTLVLLYLAYTILAVTVRGILQFIRKTVQEELGKNAPLSSEFRNVTEE